MDFTFLSAIGGKMLVAAVEFAMLVGTVYLVSRNTKLFPGSDDVAHVNSVARGEHQKEATRVFDARKVMVARNGVVTAGSLIALALLISQ